MRSKTSYLLILFLVFSYELKGAAENESDVHEAESEAGKDIEEIVYAPDEDDDEDIGFTTVITAARFETGEGDVPASMTVIDSKEIEERPVITADEILRTEASTTGRRPQGPAIVFPHVLCFRGISGIDRVLVLLDDLPLNDGLIGSPNLNMLPVDDILRIEILRGPFSALYGTNAMGGVVHVITRPGGMKPGLSLKTDMVMFEAFHASKEQISGGNVRLNR